MADIKIDLTGAKFPSRDGEINTYAYKEAVKSSQFNHTRKVIFINGMLNKGKDHVESALALSWVQMCTVIGVYNLSEGFFKDFAQCIGDKNQFDGPVSPSAREVASSVKPGKGNLSEVIVRNALSRNKAQLSIFNLLRESDHKKREIFAHSQGNLILSNALQAIEGVDGAKALSGYTIHTFGSPAVNWPKGIKKYEHAFTWDPVSFLAGFDFTWTISKVGMPKDSINPITHGFLDYLSNDPAFIVNRYRWGGLGVTFNMDEEGLARALAGMGTNTDRVFKIFRYLDAYHNSDADDVAVIYIDLIKKSYAILAALKSHRQLVYLLIKVMHEGWTCKTEKKAIEFLKAL